MFQEHRKGVLHQDQKPLEEVWGNLSQV
jgi:hypothetical protein